MTINENKNKQNEQKLNKKKKKKTTILEINTNLNSQIGIINDTSTTTTTTTNNNNNNNEKKINDLKEYLNNWNYRETIPWKFNKNIQLFALLNCFNENIIDKKLFKQLLLYLETLKGAGRVRLLEEVNNIIKKAEEQSINENQNNQEELEEEKKEENSVEGKISGEVLKRAIKLKKLLDS